MQFVIIAKRCSEFAKLHDYPFARANNSSCWRMAAQIRFPWLLLAQESTTRQRGGINKI